MSRHIKWNLFSFYIISQSRKPQQCQPSFKSILFSLSSFCTVNMMSAKPSYSQFTPFVPQHFIKNWQPYHLPSLYDQRTCTNPKFFNIAMNIVSQLCATSNSMPIPIVPNTFVLKEFQPNIISLHNNSIRYRLYGQHSKCQTIKINHTTETFMFHTLEALSRPQKPTLM